MPLAPGFGPQDGGFLSIEQTERAASPSGPIERDAPLGWLTLRSGQTGLTAETARRLAALLADLANSLDRQAEQPTSDARRSPHREDDPS